eukprot:jgi/Mesvir1/24511/Mv25992-RA.1
MTMFHDNDLGSIHSINSSTMTNRWRWPIVAMTFRRRLLCGLIVISAEASDGDSTGHRIYAWIDVVVKQKVILFHFYIWSLTQW